MQPRPAPEPTGSAHARVSRHAYYLPSAFFFFFFPQNSRRQKKKSQRRNRSGRTESERSSWTAHFVTRRLPPQNYLERMILSALVERPEHHLRRRYRISAELRRRVFPFLLVRFRLSVSPTRAQLPRLYINYSISGAYSQHFPNLDSLSVESRLHPPVKVACLFTGERYIQTSAGGADSECQLHLHLRHTRYAAAWLYGAGRAGRKRRRRGVLLGVWSERRRSYTCPLGNFFDSRGQCEGTGGNPVYNSRVHAGTRVRLKGKKLS